MFGDEQDHRQSFITSFSSSVSDLLSGTGDVDDSDRSDGAHLSKKERESALNMSAKRGGMLKRTEGTYCFWAPEVSLLYFASLHTAGPTLLRTPKPCRCAESMGPVVTRLTQLIFGALESVFSYLLVAGEYSIPYCRIRDKWPNIENIIQQAALLLVIAREFI